MAKFSPDIPSWREGNLTSNQRRQVSPYCASNTDKIWADAKVADDNTNISDKNSTLEYIDQRTDLAEYTVYELREFFQGRGDDILMNHREESSSDFMYSGLTTCFVDVLRLCNVTKAPTDCEIFQALVQLVQMCRHIWLQVVKFEVFGGAKLQVKRNEDKWDTDVSNKGLACEVVSNEPDWMGGQSANETPGRHNTCDLLESLTSSISRNLNDMKCLSDVIERSRRPSRRIKYSYAGRKRRIVDNHNSSLSQAELTGNYNGISSYGSELDQNAPLDEGISFGGTREDLEVEQIYEENSDSDGDILGNVNAGISRLTHAERNGDNNGMKRNFRAALQDGVLRDNGDIHGQEAVEWKWEIPLSPAIHKVLEHGLRTPQWACSSPAKPPPHGINRVLGSPGKRAKMPGLDDYNGIKYPGIMVMVLRLTELLRSIVKGTRLIEKYAEKEAKSTFYEINRNRNRMCCCTCPDDATKNELKGVNHQDKREQVKTSYVEESFFLKHLSTIPAYMAHWIRVKQENCLAKLKQSGDDPRRQVELEEELNFPRAFFKPDARFALVTYKGLARHFEYLNWGSAVHQHAESCKLSWSAPGRCRDLIVMEHFDPRILRQHGLWCLKSLLEAENMLPTSSRESHPGESPSPNYSPVKLELLLDVWSQLMEEAYYLDKCGWCQSWEMDSILCSAARGFRRMAEFYTEKLYREPNFHLVRGLQSCFHKLSACMPWALNDALTDQHFSLQSQLTFIKVVDILVCSALCKNALNLDELDTKTSLRELAQRLPLHPPPPPPSSSSSSQLFNTAWKKNPEFPSNCPASRLVWKTFPGIVRSLLHAGPDFDASFGLMKNLVARINQVSTRQSYCNALLSTMAHLFTTLTCAYIHHYLHPSPCTSPLVPLSSSNHHLLPWTLEFFCAQIYPLLTHQMRQFPPLGVNLYHDSANLSPQRSPSSCFPRLVRKFYLAVLISTLIVRCYVRTCNRAGMSRVPSVWIIIMIEWLGYHNTSFQENSTSLHDTTSTLHNTHLSPKCKRESTSSQYLCDDAATLLARIAHTVSTSSPSTNSPVCPYTRGWHVLNRFTLAVHKLSRELVTVKDDRAKPHHIYSHFDCQNLASSASISCHTSQLTSVPHVITLLPLHAGYTFSLYANSHCTRSTTITTTTHQSHAGLSHLLALLPRSLRVINLTTPLTSCVHHTWTWDDTLREWIISPAAITP